MVPYARRDYPCVEGGRGADAQLGTGCGKSEDVAHKTRGIRNKAFDMCLGPGVR